MADVAPLNRREQSLQAHLTRLAMRQERLILHAAHAGTWVAPRLHERLNGWIARGEVLGELINGETFRFTAVIPHERADELFQHEPDSAEIRLTGQSEHVLETDDIQLIPYQRQRLASPALGWLGGGDIAVRQDDRRGDLATESFYEIRALLPPSAVEHTLAWHGMSGRLRIALEAQPLYWQARESILQLLQKRYQL